MTKFLRSKLSRYFFILITLFIARSANAQFAEGNIAVFLAASASANNTSGSIVELNTSTANQTGIVYGIPSTGSNALRFSGSASSTGYLANSNDGTLLEFTGANSTNTSSNVNSLNPRGVGTFNVAGTYNLATTYTGVSGNQTRSATTLNDTAWYIADQGGIYTNNASSANPAGNFRGIKSFGGVVYVGQQGSSASNIQVSTVSAVSGGAITGLPGIINSSTFQDFYLISSGSNGNSYDVLYIVSNTSSTAGTITKFSLVSGTWVANGSYSTSFGGFGIAAQKQGNGAYLFVSGGNGATGTNSVVRLSDDAGYNSTISINTANNITLYTAAAGTIVKGVAFAPRASMRITEFMYSGANGEFIEFTNIGAVAVDMNQWSFDDNSRSAGSTDLSSYGVVQPGESVILTEVSAGAFRSSWNLCNGIKVIGNNTQNLGRDDEINLYDASGNLVDRLSYGDDISFPGTIRTQNISGYVTASGIGANAIAQWKLSSINDAEGSYASAGNDVGSPGKSLLAGTAYNGCGTVNGAPTIVMNTSTTTNFIDGGATTSPASPYTVSGAISDPTNPSVTQGINFTIGDDLTDVNSLIVTVSSSNTDVVTNANAILSGTGADRNLKIIPTGVGYSNITVNVSDGINTSSYIIYYAASAASATPDSTLWHNGMSDASDAIPLDDNYFVTGDDELDVLNVYSRSVSGLEAASYDYSTLLSLPDPSKPEVDVEAATRSTSVANRIYWLGSMSNGKSPFDNKPNRDRLFATTVTGTGASTNFSMVGYGAIRTSLIAWGDAQGYNFSANAAAGVDSKTPAGFAAEGIVFGPDNTTLYIGLRAPLVPTSNRTKAVIAPILNFEIWFNNGNPSGDPTYGNAIELDLGQRGIRDLIRLSNGTYIIVAGDPGPILIPAVYKWSGNATDAPVLVSDSFTDALNMEGAMEVNDNGTLSLSKLQVVSDLGDYNLYNDGSEAKDFNDLNLRKFRSDNLKNLDLTLCSPSTGDTTVIACDSFTWYDSVYTQSANPTHTFTNVTGCDSVVTLHLTINYSTSSADTVVACGSFMWNDSTYTQSGVYTFTTNNASGCDSVVTLHLTINHSTSSSDTVFACNSYMWNDSTYTQSGMYTFKTNNANGCDSTATLVLTINQPTTSLTKDTVCSNSLPFIWNGKQYSQAGTYADTTTNAAGCDSIATLQLTINPSPSITNITSGIISCHGGTTYLTITAKGGTRPFYYSINARPAHRSNTINNLKAGIYTVIVADAFGCSATQQYTITQPAILKVRTVQTRPSCKGGSDGVLQAIATGGSGNYQYSLNNGPFTSNNTFSGLTAGTYTVSVQDMNGCTASTVVTLHDGTGRCTTVIAQQTDNSNLPGQLSVKVLPNPSNTSFVLTIRSNYKEDIDISVVDVYGRTIYHTTGSANSEYRFGENFTSGMYIVKLLQGNREQTFKIIKSE